ncbi:Retinoblastoma-like protein [Carpediemonas membranifera]|uniref:Retinoblastoma-like protein n=1 Tax=Carpediemonas membranifera TaxID=201153 RepID=A0A8J6ARX2_9EUKA|nr:Retinoblastoma-like protein [Carpediemonas membranifera]|eukprot:KAG9390755.1 Retinoblastoma-like protein [Carpediemonas membranifera]
MSSAELQAVTSFTSILTTLTKGDSVDRRLLAACAVFVQLYKSGKRSVLIPADISTESRIPLKSILLWLKTIAGPKYVTPLGLFPEFSDHVDSVIYQYVYTSTYNKMYTTECAAILRKTDRTSPLVRFGWLSFAVWYNAVCVQHNERVMAVPREAFTAFVCLLDFLANVDHNPTCAEAVEVVSGRTEIARLDAEEKETSIGYAQSFFTHLVNLPLLPELAATVPPTFRRETISVGPIQSNIAMLIRSVRVLRMPAILPLCGVTGTTPHTVETPMVRPLEAYEKIRSMLNELPAEGSPGLWSTLQEKFPSVTVQALGGIIDSLMKQLPLPQLPTASDLSVIEQFTMDVKRLHFHTLHSVLLEFSITSSAERRQAVETNLLSPRFHKALVACELDAILFIRRMFTLYPPYAIRGLRTTPIEYVSLMDVLLNNGPTFTAEVQKHLIACRTYSLETLFWVPELYYTSPLPVKTPSLVPENRISDVINFLSLEAHPMLKRLSCFEHCPQLDSLVSERIKTLTEMLDVHWAGEEISKLFYHAMDTYPLFFIHRHTSFVIALCTFVVLSIASECITKRFPTTRGHIGMRLVMHILTRISPLGKSCFLDIVLNPLADPTTQVRGSISTLYPLFLTLIHAEIPGIKARVAEIAQTVEQPTVDWEAMLQGKDPKELQGHVPLSKPKETKQTIALKAAQDKGDLPPRAPKTVTIEAPRSPRGEPIDALPQQTPVKSSSQDCNARILAVTATPASLLRRVQESTRGSQAWADFNVSERSFVDAPVRRFGQAFRDEDGLGPGHITRHTFSPSGPERKREKTEEDKPPSESLMTLADLVDLVDGGSPDDELDDAELTGLPLPMPTKLSDREKADASS